MPVDVIDFRTGTVMKKECVSRASTGIPTHASKSCFRTVPHPTVNVKAVLTMIIGRNRNFILYSFLGTLKLRADYDCDA